MCKNHIILNNRIRAVLALAPFKGRPGSAFPENIDKILQNIDFLFFVEKHSSTSVVSGHHDETVEKPP